jgi:phospholipase A1
MKAAVLLLSVVFAVNNASGSESEANVLYGINKCLLNALGQAVTEQTVAELRQSCWDKARTLSKQRVAQEKQALQNIFAIIPYKPNFVSPASITSTH